MARTPLAQRIEDAYGEVVEGRTTRRELVKRTAVAGAALAATGTMGRFAKAAYGAAQPQIAIVGGRPGRPDLRVSPQAGGSQRPDLRGLRPDGRPLLHRSATSRR